jgi:hypothetical protein
MPKARPVGSLIFRHYDFLSSLARTRSAKRRTSLLKQANADQILSIVEVAHNLLALDKNTGKPLFHLTNRQKAKLIPQASIIRRIARARSERGARRHIQKGCGFPLAALLVPVIAEVARSLLQRKSDG